MKRFALAFLVLCVACQAYSQDLPASAKKAYENAAKKVQKNREIYESGNEKVMAGLKKELEKINPPVDVDAIVSTFQKGIMELDAKARPPAPPPPEKGVLVFNGHRYKLVEENLKWDDAKTKCEQMGGHLLTIEDRVEQEFISQKLSAYLKENIQLPAEATVWLGIKKDAKAGSWHLSNGDIQKFTSWDPRGNAPNDCYAVMHCRLGIWMGWSSPEVNPNIFFICEWDK